MHRTMMPFNILIVVVLCCSIINVTGKPIKKPKQNPPLTADKLGLSKQDFEDYKKKAMTLQELIAVFNKVTINKKDLTPQFDDMIFPLDVIETLIARYNFLLSKGKNKRNKRKIFEFKIYRARMRWVFSERNPIPYTVHRKYSKKYAAEIDKAFQYWEKHTCTRFRKMVTTTDYHIRVEQGDGNWGCSAVTGKNVEKSNNNSQPITLGSDCFPYFGIAVHEIGHALGLIHEQMKNNAKDFTTFKKENLHSPENPWLLANFLPWEGIAALGVPYDLNSIMHYSGVQASRDETNINVLLTKDPLYQNNIGQRVELSFLDKKIVNLEYCKDACPKVLNCHRNGYTDPNNCAQCVCPDGFGGRLCDTVGDVHHKACQKPQIIKVTDTEQCITMKPYKPFTECHWHLKAGNGQKIELYFKNEFAVFCFGDFSCYHWVEIKYKGDYSMPGPRFCCDETPKTKLLSDTNFVIVSFKSSYKEKKIAAKSKGFQLCFNSGSCSEKEVLTCNTMNKWEIKTEFQDKSEPALSKTTLKRAIDGCQGEVKTKKTIRFLINLVGERLFKIDKLCVKTNKAIAVLIFLQKESSSRTTVQIPPKQSCLDATVFTHVGPVNKVTIEVQTKREISISIHDIMMNVCKQ